MFRRCAKPCFVLPALLVGGLLLLAAPAHAETTTVAEVVKDLATSLKSKEAEAVATGLESIVASFAAAEKRDRTSLLSAVGKVLRKKDPELKRAALDAFEAMGDPDAWKHYRTLLPGPLDKPLTPIQSQALDVTRALTPEGAVGPLLAMMRKSKNLGAASAALRTLGAYKTSRSRARILDTIIAATIKERPGIRGRDNTVVYGPRQTGEQARNRWQALAGPMVKAANELTGREVTGPEAWFVLWRDNRRDLASLFEGE